jgi:hypothetical protein
VHSLPIAVESSDSSRERRSWRSAAVAWSLLFSAVLMGAVYAFGPPQAKPSRAAVSQLVQQVVQQQLQALASQDAMQAFALADTDLRTQFGSADAFLATVRTQYPMLMHSSSVLFFKPQTNGTSALQKVRMSDDEGSSWTLTYLLNRQQDNQWRISGCVVTPEGRQLIV